MRQAVFLQKGIASLRILHIKAVEADFLLLRSACIPFPHPENQCCHFLGMVNGKGKLLYHFLGASFSPLNIAVDFRAFPIVRFQGKCRKAPFLHHFLENGQLQILHFFTAMGCLSYRKNGNILRYILCGEGLHLRLYPFDFAMSLQFLEL